MSDSKFASANLCPPEQETGLAVNKIGLVDYAEVWSLQKKLQQELIQEAVPETLILCQHPAVITVGRSGSIDNLLCSPESLAARGIQFFEVERGGDITFHGPGQIVAYPIINLSKKRRDVAWYMRMLEQVLLITLLEFNIKAFRVSGRTGIWTQPLENAIDSRTGDRAGDRKIASIGVRISRWCTMHGLALNVQDCGVGFSLINPCGFSDISITSMEQETGSKIRLAEVEARLLAHFVELFRYRVL